MQSFDIVTLRVFLAVARLGSIGAAARHEHIATSAASRRISDLEEDLDTVLISRTPGGVSLTPAGHAFSRHCEELLKRYSDVRADLKRFSEGQVGHFRIAAIPCAMRGPLPDIIAEFKRTHPAVHVTIKEIFSSEGPRFLREDLADLVIIYDTGNLDGYVTKLYKEDPIYVIGRKDHPLFDKHPKGKPIKYKQTLGYELVSLHEGGWLDELIGSASREEGEMLHYDTKVMRVHTMLRCIEAGLGLGFFGAHDLAEILEQKNLVAAPLAEDWAARNIVCAYPKGQAEAPIMTSFLNDLFEEGNL